jgi:hypothetical protein
MVRNLVGFFFCVDVCRGLDEWMAWFLTTCGVEQTSLIKFIRRLPLVSVWNESTTEDTLALNCAPCFLNHVGWDRLYSCPTAVPAILCTGS